MFCSLLEVEFVLGVTCVKEAGLESRMTYSVMQTGLEPPSAEQLKNAFQGVPGLTAMDVTILGKDAYGVLMKGFELERAAAMQSALAAQGVETEVVDDATLPELPPARQLTKASFTPEALRIDDWLGRSVPLEWSNIGVIAAGRTRLTDFTRDLVEKVVMVRAGRHLVPKVVTEAVTREEQKDHLLLEIISGGQTGADRAGLDWPIKHGIPCGGWCPKGRRAEGGPINAKYQLQDNPHLKSLTSPTDRRGFRATSFIAAVLLLP